MTPTATPLQGLFLLELDAFRDPRGRFERLFCETDWSRLRPQLHFPQVNLSLTHRRGCVRGLHYQRSPHAEAKLIRCVRGRVYDVAVDLRPDSRTFLAWHGYELDADEPRAAFIPEGFAHGFQALSDDAQLLYFHTAAYAPSHEAARPLLPGFQLCVCAWLTVFVSLSCPGRTGLLSSPGFVASP